MDTILANIMNFSHSKNQQDNIKNALYNEFTCYINVELLPINWDGESFLNDLVKESATRLTSIIESTNLIKIINIMIQNREHDLNKLTSAAGNFEWVIEDEDWLSYIRLLNKIVKNISNINVG